MKVQIEVDIGNINLEHMQESVTESIFGDERVTFSECELIRKIIIQLIKNRDKNEG